MLVTLPFDSEWDTRPFAHAALAAGISPSAHVENVLRQAYIPAASRPGARLALLRTAFEAARDWIDLQTRLRRLGYVLRLAGESGLWLHSWPDDRPLMPADEMGHDLSGLILRFRAPFPGATPDRAERPALPSLRPQARRG